MKHLTKYIAILFAIGAFTTDVARGQMENTQAQKILTSRIVSELIERVGPSKALAALYDNAEQWEALRSGIGKGDKDWLMIAVRLFPASDAHPAEQLILSVGEALEHSPSEVLRTAIPTFSLKQICGAPDLDDGRYDSYFLSMQSIELRKKQVGRIHDPSVKDIGEQCIMFLEESKKGVARFYGIDIK